MTPEQHGIALLARKYAECTTMHELAQAWNNTAYAYQSMPAVQQAKDKRKGELA